MKRVECKCFYFPIKPKKKNNEKTKFPDKYVSFLLFHYKCFFLFFFSKFYLIKSLRATQARIMNNVFEWTYDEEINTDYKDMWNRWRSTLKKLSLLR